MQSPITIGRAGARDAPAIAECLESAFAPFRNQYTPGAYADTVLDADGVLKRMAHMTVHVAVTESGEVVGTIASTAGERTGHLRGMAVRPEWQGHHIAEQLLLEAENELRSAGCARITLGTTDPLQRAMRFYANHGYVPTGRVSDFFGMDLHEYAKKL